jgi:hypothetical protein
MERVFFTNPMGRTCNPVPPDMVSIHFIADYLSMRTSKDTNILSVPSLPALGSSYVTATAVPGARNDHILKK